MAGSDREGSPLPISGIAALVLMVAGTVLLQLSPLVTSRPRKTEAIKSQAANVQDVDARLWQDPLAAADQHRTQTGGKGSISAKRAATLHSAPAHALRHGPAALGCRVATTPGTVVLGVMIFGGPYVEDAEHRRRTRYAVVSGLGVSGFVPDDPDHIGYVLPEGSSRAPGAAMADRRPLPELVPYEWFARDPDQPGTSSSGSPVLVLWLDEAAFLRDPLSNLNDLLAQVTTCPGRAKARLSQDSPAIKILGPAGSTTLKEMIREADKRNESRKPPLAHLAGSEFYTAMATVSDTRLVKSPKTIPAVFAGQKITFTRLIARDNDLMKSLIKELRLRGLDFTQPSNENSLVLVTDSDTFYGRTLSEEVIAGVQEKSPGAGEWVERVSYFRGLDGVLPNAADTGSEDAPAKRVDGEKKKEDPAPVERMDGDGQGDYLRRLASRVKRRDEQLRREHKDPSNGIRGVGVLGSDLYDKLLVLEALRRQLPDAIFFTTDLDARFLQAREFRWTRSLIVVSSFGLELHPDLQGGVPPFRDSYQTATFYTTQVALGKIERAKGGVGQLEQQIRESPRVFEIGRGIAFDLTSEPVGSSCGGPGPSPCARIHPAPSPLFPMPGKRAKTFGAIAMVLVLVLCDTASSRVRRLRCEVGAYFRERPRALWIAAIGLVGVAGGIAVLLRKIVDTGSGAEPFSLVDGISLWPTEILRLIAAGFAGGFLIKGWRDVRATTTEMETEFRLAGERDGVMGPEASEGGTRRWSRVNPFARIWGLRPESPDVNAETVWNEYRQDGSLLSRSVRVAFESVLYLGAGVCVIFGTGRPHVPYRGPITWWIDLVVLVGAVVMVVVLINAVSDATHLSARVVRELSKRGSTQWPQRTLERFREQLGFAPCDAVCPVQRGLGLDRWIDVRFIARMTATTGTLIYYPFIALFLMILSRATWFDDWSTPIGLAIVFVVSLSYALACAFTLRSRAETARTEAIGYLTPVLIRLKGNKDCSNQAEQLRIMIEEIRTIREGAFASFSQQPVVRALVGSFSGIGGLGVLQYLFGGF